MLKMGGRDSYVNRPQVRRKGWEDSRYQSPQIKMREDGQQDIPERKDINAMSGLGEWLFYQTVLGYFLLRVILNDARKNSQRESKPGELENA